MHSQTWVELSQTAMIDPSIIWRLREFSVDIEVDHGRNYGETVSFENGGTLPGTKLMRPSSSVSTLRSFTTCTLNEEVTQHSQ